MLRPRPKSCRSSVSRRHPFVRFLTHFVRKFFKHAHHHIHPAQPDCRPPVPCRLADDLKRLPERQRHPVRRRSVLYVFKNHATCICRIPHRKYQPNPIEHLVCQHHARCTDRNSAHAPGHPRPLSPVPLKNIYFRFVCSSTKLKTLIHVHFAQWT